MEISLFAILIAIIVLIVLTGINLRKLNMESYSAVGAACNSDDDCASYNCSSATRKCAASE
jgi:hypothetical protein